MCCVLLQLVTSVRIKEEAYTLSTAITALRRSICCRLINTTFTWVSNCVLTENLSTWGQETSILCGALPTLYTGSHVVFFTVNSHFKKRNTKRFSSLQLLDTGTRSTALHCWGVLLRKAQQRLFIHTLRGAKERGLGVLLKGEGYSCEKAFVALRPTFVSRDEQVCQTLKVWNSRGEVTESSSEW